jgi:hypothetical protein
MIDHDANPHSGLVSVRVIATLREFLISGSLMGLIVFAPSVFLAIIGAFLWAGLTALANAVMRLVSGLA